MPKNQLRVIYLPAIPLLSEYWSCAKTTRFFISHTTLLDDFTDSTSKNKNFHKIERCCFLVLLQYITIVNHLLHLVDKKPQAIDS